MRDFAIIVSDGDQTKAIDLVDKLPSGSTVYVFCDSVVYSDRILPDGKKEEDITFPEEYKTFPKRINYAVKYAKEHSTADYLHVIDCTTEIKTDPTLFMTEIEKMMCLFNLDDWFNTTCDSMNYIFSKYNPRIRIALDAEKYNCDGLNEIVFTSHANTQWIVVDLKKINDAEHYLPDEYTIPMFVIIEHLADRRAKNDGNTIDFMNMYPTVSSEYGVFNTGNGKKDDFTQEQYAKEDAMFRAKNINFSPTNSIDNVLKVMYNILKQKAN